MCNDDMETLGRSNILLQIQRNNYCIYVTTSIKYMERTQIGRRSFIMKEIDFSLDFKVNKLSILKLQAENRIQVILMLCE